MLLKGVYEAVIGLIWANKETQLKLLYKICDALRDLVPFAQF